MAFLNGDIVNNILRAENKHEKEYIVSVDKPITPEFVEKMSYVTFDDLFKHLNFTTFLKAVA